MKKTDFSRVEDTSQSLRSLHGEEEEEEEVGVETVRATPINPGMHQERENGTKEGSCMW